MKKIAVFGSAFNPPTLGHADVIAQCLKMNAFDKILLVPSISHVFAKKMAPFEDRVELLTLFLEDLSEQSPFKEAHHILELTLCEQELYEPAPRDDQSPPPVSTYQVLKYLETVQAALYDERCQLTFIIGPDNQALLPKFQHAKKLQKEFEILAVEETLKLRSTDLRLALQNGKSLHPYTTNRVALRLPEIAYYASK